MSKKCCALLTSAVLVFTLITRGAAQRDRHQYDGSEDASHSRPVTHLRRPVASNKKLTFTYDWHGPSATPTDFAEIGSRLSQGSLEKSETSFRELEKDHVTQTTLGTFSRSTSTAVRRGGSTIRSLYSDDKRSSAVHQNRRVPSASVMKQIGRAVLVKAQQGHSSTTMPGERSLSTYEATDLSHDTSDRDGLSATETRERSLSTYEATDLSHDTSNRDGLSATETSRDPHVVVNSNGSLVPSPQNSSHRTDHCGYTFSDRSCPPPTAREMRYIDSLCDGTEIMMDAIFSVSLALGLPGSSLVLITVYNMPVTPGTFYMGFLAASDFVCLMFGIDLMYKLPDDGSLGIQEVAVIWVGRIFQTFSHWILAFMCLERLVSVKLPTHKARIYTMRNTRLSVGAAFAVSAVPFLMTCVHYTIFEYSVDIELYLGIVQNLVYIIFPGGLVVISSVLTALQLKRAAKRRETMMTSRGASRSSRLDSDLTLIMLLTSFCFVVFTFPWGAIHIFDRLRNLYCPPEEALFSFFFYGFLGVSFFNHAVNFYVYFLCAGGFRDQCWRVICRRKH